MSRRAPMLVAGLAAVLLVACAGNGARPPQRWFVLGAPAASASAAASTAPRHAGTLLLAPATATAFYDSQDIAYGKSASTRAYYQYSQWTESPARRLDALLAARLEAAGRFGAVAAASSGVRGRWLLRVQLDEIWHDASTPPGSARVVLTAELTEPGQRALLARRTFSAAVPAASFDADGAVAGLGSAMSQVLDELATWADRSVVE